MKATIAIMVFALFAFAGSPLASASSTTRNADDREVTGCLEKGANPEHYQLMAQDGSTWQVKDGRYVSLSPYVGENVTVAGPASSARTPATQADKAESARMNQSAQAESRLTVLDVAVDGQSCRQ
ncbi:MAG: hypothetical protein WCC87_11235 [Candidatus Korobacteraceae bacterium]